MNSDHIEEFIYLAETLSFTKTAERFYTSRSAISRHIAAMEQDLGVRLLERDRHNVSLTKEGVAFQREARVLVEDFRRLVESTQHVFDDGARTLRIGYLRNAARPFIMHFANHLKEHYAHIRPIFSCMKYDELCQAMAEQRVDVALSMDFADALEGAYRPTSIYEDRLYAVMAASDSLAAMHGGVKCDDLSGRKLLLSDSLSCPGLNSYLVQAFGAKSAFISFEYFDDADVTQLRLRVDGSIALLSGRNALLSGDDTVALPLSDVDLSFTANAYLKADLDDELARACKDTLRSCAQALDASAAASRK